MDKQEYMLSQAEDWRKSGLTQRSYCDQVGYFQLLGSEKQKARRSWWFCRNKNQQPCWKQLRSDLPHRSCSSIGDR